VSQTDEIVPATIVSVRGLEGITVQLRTGEEIIAVLDVAALRERYGRIYGINIGGSCEVILGSRPRIVGISPQR